MVDEDHVRRVVVTGASSGIGAQAARALAGDGWSVVALARRADRLASLAREIVQAGGKCEYRVCDVTDEESTSAAVEGIVSGGPVKALVNCAGGAVGEGSGGHRKSG
ncbi:MAG: SDR family NAD(P)-dependent oxidoreductase [Bifidobacterium sp.]|jgi:NADP-dependent 3-hydroxy acid dehydrogenase YdfG